LREVPSCAVHIVGHSYKAERTKTALFTNHELCTKMGLAMTALTSVFGIFKDAHP
jgi:hypothetical protein